MANGAPRALTASLPSVVPRLVDLVCDSNPQVTDRAGKALEAIAAVITNPEIVLVTPKLLAALSNPGKETKAAVASLMSTSYVHPVDAASLSLLMPILAWGLKDRAQDTKRASVQVVGSACALVKDDKDLRPYVKDLLPELMELTMDSIPDTRLFAAKAIGMLVRRFGEREAPNLIEWLLNKMEFGKNQMERHGTALCLAEVLFVIGINRLEMLLPELRIKLASPNAGVREGFMAFLLHLPVKFPEKLKDYIPEIMKMTFAGMTDGGQPVRVCAKEVGVQLMQVYYLDMDKLVLPALETALLDNKFKESSIRLFGYLLARCADVFDLQLDPDEMQASDAAVNKVTTNDGLKIIKIMGKEKRDYILAKVNLYRFDDDQSVRDMCGRVLRSVCENLKKDQADFFDQSSKLILEFLNQDNRANQEMAARCLGTTAGTLFEGVVGAIIPEAQNLLKGEEEPTIAKRIGILLALSQLVIQGHKDKLGPHYEDIHLALMDGLLAKGPELASVREAAVELFGTAAQGMRKTYGEKVTEDTIKALVAAINEGDKAAVKSLKLLVAPEARLKTEKKETVHKYARSYLEEKPVKALAKEVEEVMEAANKLLPAAKQTKAAATVKLSGKKSDLLKGLEKGLKAGKSGEKKIKKEKGPAEPSKSCPKKNGRCMLPEGHTGGCSVDNVSRTDARNKAKNDAKYQ